MKIFSNEPVNCGRQSEIDLLRGFTAIVIIICHVGLYLGNGISTGLWTFCDLIGSEWAAPILMVLMGISMVYSHHYEPQYIFKRGIHLFILGYILNIYRSLLPLLILGPVDEWASIEGLFVVDILPFAGIAFMFIALLKKLKLPNGGILIISVVFVIADMFIMLPESVPWDNEIITGIVNLFCPTSEGSCFPFLTWFVFPAFGLCLGDLLTHCTDKKRLYAVMLPVGLLGVLYVYWQFHLLYPDYTSYYWGNNFYYMGLKNVLLTMLFICFALAFWFFADKILPDIIKRFLCFLSKNLNTFYLISWIIVSTLMHVQAMSGWIVGSLQDVIIMVIVILLCAVLSEIWLNAKKKFHSRRKTPGN